MTIIKDNKLSNIVIIFLGAENEGNIGAIARAMKNFDLNKLVLVDSKVEIGDIARMMAMHGEDVLNKTRNVSSLEEATKDADFIIGTTAISGGDYNILRVSVPPEDMGDIVGIRGKICIIFGRESRGLSNEELDRCDSIITVPSSSKYPTLNVAQAATIVFYELFKAVRSHRHIKYREADRIEKEKLVDYFKELLRRTSYPVRKQYIALRIFRSILGRSFISGRESHTLMGVFRRALKML
ncbi:MAG: RNA methyltransferase [Promethearchaeota archaeon]